MAFRGALAFRPQPAAPPRFSPLLLASNLLFAAAFFLQWDVGDGSSWLTLTALLNGGPGSPTAKPPAWLEHPMNSVVAFLPVSATWWLMGRRRRKKT